MDYLAKNWKSLLVVAISIVGFILLTTSLLAPIITCAKIGDKSLIITFIGVLATFVVVGNFAQTSFILSETKEKLQGYEERIKKGEEAKIEFNTLKERVDAIESLSNSISNQKPFIDEKDLAKLFKLFIGPEGNAVEQMFLYNMLLDKNSIYPLKMKDGNEINAKLGLNADNNIEFKLADDKPINMAEIVAVRGVNFNYENLNYAYQLLKQIKTPETGEINNDTTGNNAPVNEQTSK